MKMIKQFGMICVAFFLLFCIHPLRVSAGNILTVDANGRTTGVEVSGTTEASVLAVVVQVRDASSNILTMETFAVVNNAYQASINLALTAGEYKVCVADFEGGNWREDDFTVVDSGSGSTGDSGDTGSQDTSDDSSDNQSTVANTSAKEETVNVPIEYIVVKGDTLGKIARLNHMSLSQLLAMNPQIKNPNLIRIGQKIIVGNTSKVVTSQTTTTTTTKSDATFYIVKKGDSLYKIAKLHNMTYTKLIALNPNVVGRKYIYPGQKIRVK